MILPFTKVLTDPKLFGPFFPDPSWRKWKELWGEIEREKVSQFFLAKGRASGGSRMLAAKALHSCVFMDWLPYLAPGEVATALVLASDQRQAGETFGYAEGLIDSVPFINQMIAHRTKQVIEFENRTRIEVRVSNFRKVRGYTLCFAGMDELSFWADSTTGANPSKQVYRAILPALGRLPGSFLFAGSTPWSGSGFFAQMINQHKEGTYPRIMARVFDTLSLNPNFDRKIIDDAYRDDPQAAAAEYGGQFRSDLENYISSEVVAAIIIRGRFELPYVPGLRYTAFTDPSGGSSDSFTLAVSHNENGIAVLDLVREIRPPFSPEQATKDLCEVLKAYRINSVCGDPYAGQWPREMFRKFGVNYTVSNKDKSTIYSEFLPLANSGRIQMLEHHKMIAQLTGLERSVRPGTKEKIDHVPGAHDDLINAAAGSLLNVSTEAANDLNWIVKTQKTYHGPRRPFAGSSNQVVHTERGLERVGTRRSLSNLNMRVGNKKF